MNRYSRGLSLIDVVVGVALMLVLFMALFGVLKTSLEVSVLAKAKASAIELVNTQMEYMRGISYSSLGTIGGIPTGTIPQYATTTIDGIPYQTHTYIEYYDDPADGIGGADTNAVTTDYKVGKVSVTYTIHGLTRSVSVASNFVPPGIESSTGGGTLSIRVLNAYGANIGDATVRIVNASTSPTIDFTTFTDTTGLVLIGGAATSSEYQIYVTKAGDSSAQTYARVGQNVNPTPGYLTVSKDLTTSSTFQIDQLASLIVASFSPASTTSFTDSFADASNLNSQTGTQILNGLTLVSQGLSGWARSNYVSPTSLVGWGILSATLSTPTNTTAVVHVVDSTGNLLPDAVLPGNVGGFSSFPVLLTTLSTSTYPTLALTTDLTSTSTTTAPTVQSWSLSYTTAPAILPNISFTLRGNKTIGTTAGGQPIYKTTLSDTTGASASKTEPLEWDSYTLTASNIIESCPSSPIPLAPAQASTTALIIGTLSTNTLPVVVEDTSGNALNNAKVILSKNGYVATIPTSSCGLSFFNNLGAGTYSATISAVGHATSTFSGIAVSGRTATSTFSLP